MHLIFISIVVFVPFVASRETVLEAAVTRECFDIIYRYTCDSTTYQQDGANIALMCGSDYLVYAENYAAACVRGDDGDFCFHLFTDSPNLDLTQVALLCASAINSTSCTTDCRDLLQSFVNEMGCCFNTIFNERLSQLLLGHSVVVSLDACGVDTPPACRSTFNLQIPDNADSCTYDEFWKRTVDYLCRTDVGQPYVDALLENPSCTPIARHYVNACSRGINGTYCLELFGTSFNPTVPTRTAFEHPELSNALTLCANYSSFRSEGCPSQCKGALELAIDEVGCCINHFNDSINEVLLPHFSGDVITACDVKSPGMCESDITIEGRAGSNTCTATAWFYICLSLALLYGLN